MFTPADYALGKQLFMIFNAGTIRNPAQAWDNYYQATQNLWANAAKQFKAQILASQVRMIIDTDVGESG